MPSCASCGTTILFGGRTEGPFRYCNDKCYAAGTVHRAAAAVPEDLVFAEAQRIHQGACPECGGAGPVDVHFSHTVLSFILLTRWNSKGGLSCRSCARKRQGGALALTLVGGWWGFPWGLVMTPIYVLRNISAMSGGPAATAPSSELMQVARMHLGAQLHAMERNQPIESAAQG